MIRIAICDDENAVCSTIEKMLFKAAMELSLQIQTDVYYTGERLCERLESGEYYDIIFLDIELECKNGVEVGRFIREKLVNDTVQIAYVSGKTHYAMELFKISPIDFLVKPIEYPQLYDVMSKLARIKKIYADVFSYKVGHDTYNEKIQNILYFKSEDRKVIIVTFDKIDEFYGSLDDVYQQLKDFGFVSIHRSYLINYNNVKLFKYDSLTMLNGEELKISQSKRKYLRDFQIKLEIEGNDKRFPN